MLNVLRSLNNAEPSGRNATPHATSTPLAMVLTVPGFGTPAGPPCVGVTAISSLKPDTLPAASRARTLNLYSLPVVRPAAVAPVAEPSAEPDCAPSVKMSYQATLSLSVDAVH